MSSARDTGVRQAKGQWIVRLDSDHGLLPGALEFLHMQTLQAPYAVGVLGARYEWDTGWISPEFVPDDVIGYIEFVRWWEQEGGHDYLHCERRELYRTVQWPRRRGSMNTLFQLNWASQWHARFFNEVLAMQYTDAANSYHRAERHHKARWRLRDAADQAWALDEIFRLHGETLRQYAPTHYKNHLVKASFNHFLAGHRQQGLCYALEFVGLDPRSPYGWAILAFGLLGTRPLLWAYCQKPYFE
jgi:glycosyltransferase involved in cell wall biosynthesis